ncbi:MAG: hypothetical protein JOZ62_14840 [Acidobacteriaceae bacterium]|nr:hypothetical protein [Acidobacteriaceae bacterium]
MVDFDDKLNDLFRSYRASCPDPEPSVTFMPGLWRKIEVRHSFWFSFERLARMVTTVSAVLCLLLLALNLFSTPQNHNGLATYADALAAEHTAEATYYTEAIRSQPSDQAPDRNIANQ